MRRAVVDYWLPIQQREILENIDIVIAEGILGNSDIDTNKGILQKNLA